MPFQPSIPLPLRRPASRRWLPLGVVLALHVVGLGTLASLRVWRDRVPAPTEPPLLIVWLLNGKPPPAAPESRAAATPTAGGRGPAVALPQVPQVRQPEAITWPAAVPDAAAPAAATVPGPAIATAEAAASAASAPPQPLNLALPRSASAPWRQRSLAAGDPRSNTRAPVNMATLVGRALSDDASEPITEQRLEDGSIKFRRGNRCLIVHPSQTQVLNPFNSSTSPKPGVVDSC